MLIVILMDHDGTLNLKLYKFFTITLEGKDYGNKHGMFILQIIWYVKTS